MLAISQCCAINKSCLTDEQILRALYHPDKASVSVVVVLRQSGVGGVNMALVKYVISKVFQASLVFFRNPSGVRRKSILLRGLTLPMSSYITTEGR